MLSDNTLFDLVFLDIQMGGIDGIETAQKLRVENKKCALFYVTSYKGNTAQLPQDEKYDIIVV